MFELQNGFMNDGQIRKALSAKELVIYPYSDKNLTPVGYNLSFSRFIVSLRKRSFVKLYKDKDKPEWFFYLNPHETVLILTREAIWVSKFIGGIFQSKVSMVTKGIGHVSTTLDPGWQGQLLVPINNPTRRKIKIPIAFENNAHELEYYTFITMVLFHTREAACSNSDNKSARLELLETVLTEGHRSPDRKVEEILNEIKSNIGYPVLNDDLNDPEDRVAKVKRFKSEYKKLINIMDHHFNTVNEISKKEHIKSASIFGIVFLLSFIVVIGITYAAYQVFGKEYPEMVNVVVSVLIPFTMLFLNHIKERFI